MDEKSFLQVATDRISSFDVVMTNGIPGKGKILNQMALFWFDFLEKNGGCPNHIITGNVDEMPEAVRKHADMIRGRCMLVKKLEMCPVESIVRGYITGSGFKDYKATGAVCGIKLPEGLVDCQKLEENIFTPSSKAEYGAHDENITEEQAFKLLAPGVGEELKKQSLHYYDVASKHAASKGIILADTKFEFGFVDGKLTLADEIFTPDCSRFWDMAKYEPGRQQDSLDKQYVRNYLLSINFDKTNPIELPQEVSCWSSPRDACMHRRRHLSHVACLLSRPTLMCPA